MSEAVSAIAALKGLRDLRNYSAAKDIMAKNPDYATNPEVIAKIGQANPEMGMELVSRAGAAREMWQQQAAQRLISQIQAWDAPADEYNTVLTKGGNFAEANKAANTKLQQWYGLLEQQYGPGFANTVRKQMPTWSLETYASQRGDLDKLAEVMRSESQVVMTDPDTGEKRLETVRLLPGAERQNYLERNKAYKPLFLKQGESVPELTTYNQGALGPGTTTRGEIKTNPMAEQARHEAEFFTKLPTVTSFLKAEPVYARGKQANRLGTKTGDQQASVALALLDNPGAVASEGGIEVVANPGLLKAETQQWLNLLNSQGGQFTTDQRREIDKALDITYSDLRKQFLGQREAATLREQDLHLKPGTITGYAKYLSDEELKQLREAPFNDTKPPVGGKADPQAIQSALSVVKNPKATVPAFTSALKVLPEGDLLSVNRKQLTDQQLAAYVAELKARKDRAKKGGR